MDHIEIRLVRSPIQPYGKPSRKRKIKFATDVAHVFGPIFEGAIRESLYSVALDASNAVLGATLVGAGTADRAPAHAREVFGPAMLVGAVKVILVHNHPTGQIDPSPTDMQLTRRMREAGELIGIPLVDHVIIGFDEDTGETRYHSFHEAGIL